jgi:hypothetical protein
MTPLLPSWTVVRRCYPGLLALESPSDHPYLSDYVCLMHLTQDCPKKSLSLEPLSALKDLAMLYLQLRVFSTILLS